MRSLVKLALGAALCASLAPTAVRAQDTTTVLGTSTLGSRMAIEGYLAQYSIETDANERAGSGGFGARVMFNRGDVSKTVNSLFDRARAGVFATFTAKQKGNNLSTLHVGGEVDVGLFAQPINGWLDPFVSLGAGFFRAGVDAGNGRRFTTSDLALTPAVGTLVPITGPVNFRGDVRDVIIFGEKTTNNFVIEGGISVAF